MGSDNNSITMTELEHAFLEHVYEFGTNEKLWKACKGRSFRVNALLVTPDEIEALRTHIKNFTYIKNIPSFDIKEETVRGNRQKLVHTDNDYQATTPNTNPMPGVPNEPGTAYRTADGRPVLQTLENIEITVSHTLYVEFMTETEEDGMWLHIGVLPPTADLNYITESIKGTTRPAMPAARAALRVLCLAS